MIRPTVAKNYDDVDLKLGIKSSLPNVKATLALLCLMWKEMGHPCELEYSAPQGNAIVVKPEILEKLKLKLEQLSETFSIEELSSKVNDNLMFKSQLEALLVAFELIWRVAKIRFTDGKPNGAERTGGSRFPKKLWYTSNMDLLDTICGTDTDYDRILFNWLGINLPINNTKEQNLVHFLTNISESAFYKLSYDGNEVIFNMESVYDVALSGDETVDVSGDKEAKGPLRILKSALSEGLFSYLKMENNGIQVSDRDALKEYAERVSTYHQLTPKSYTVTEVVESKEIIDNEESFKQWLSNMKKENGEPYSQNTQSQYLSAMRTAATLFADILNPYEKIYNISSVEALDELRNKMENDTRYDDFNKNRGSGELPACLILYRRFLVETSMVKYRTGCASDFPRNRILFGAPGTGKSFTLNSQKDSLLSDGGLCERVTFHPDYSYANFVGTYKPVPSVDSNGNETITYTYVPGPFMRIYVEALKNSRTATPLPHLLIVEEINRANVAAVFGDIFQLLDRDESGVSEYPIHASEDIKNYLAKELGGNPSDFTEIQMPDNMFVWATMNSADQGVFPMDTAFKRRWDFTYLGIDDNDNDIQGKYVVVGTKEQQHIEWNSLRKAINEFLAEQKINEDKQLGPYFIARDIVVPKNGSNEIDSKRFGDVFKHKVLMYLFDDAGKQKRTKLFEGSSKGQTRYSKICEAFDEQGIGIFPFDIQSKVEIVDLKVNGQDVNKTGAKDMNE